MDTYAIVLYFDDISNKKLNKMIKMVADASDNRYMLDVGIPPHVSIALFYSSDLNMIEEKTGEFAKNVKASEIIFEKIGAFPPRVLFVSPRKDKYLSDLNRDIHQILLKDFQADTLYLPENWVPHCSLAVRLNDIQLQKAKSAVEKTELPLAVRAERVVLAKCNPYLEICSWEIPLG